MDEKTSTLLDELKHAIEALEDGHGDRALVADLAGRVERRLDAEAELTDDDDSLAEELKESAVRFEADHPKLAGILRQFVDGLGGLGL